MRRRLAGIIAGAMLICVAIGSLVGCGTAKIPAFKTDLRTALQNNWHKVKRAEDGTIEELSESAFDESKDQIYRVLMKPEKSLGSTNGFALFTEEDPENGFIFAALVAFEDTEPDNFSDQQYILDCKGDLLFKDTLYFDTKEHEKEWIVFKNVPASKNEWVDIYFGYSSTGKITIDGSVNPCDEKGLSNCSYIQSDAPNQNIADLEDAYTVFDYSDGKSKRVGFGN